MCAMRGRSSVTRACAERWRSSSPLRMPAPSASFALVSASTSLPDARETRGEMELHVRVILEREGGLVLLDAELRVARLLRFDRFLRELERARVRPSAAVRGRGAAEPRAADGEATRKPASATSHVETSREEARARSRSVILLSSSSSRTQASSGPALYDNDQAQRVRLLGATPCRWWIGGPEPMPLRLENAASVGRSAHHADPRRLARGSARRGDRGSASRKGTGRAPLPGDACEPPHGRVSLAPRRQAPGPGRPPAPTPIRTTGRPRRFAAARSTTGRRRRPTPTPAARRRRRRRRPRRSPISMRRSPAPRDGTKCTPCHAPNGNGGKFFVATDATSSRAFFLANGYQDITKANTFATKGQHSGNPLTADQKTLDEDLVRRREGRRLRHDDARRGHRRRRLSASRPRAAGRVRCSRPIR